MNIAWILVYIFWAGIIYGMCFVGRWYNKSKESHFRKDQFFCSNHQVSGFFWRYYRETKNFPLPHLMISDLIYDGVDKHRGTYVHFDSANQFILEVNSLSFKVNLLSWFENPFNPTDDELVLWELEQEHHKDYKALMVQFCRNWHECGGPSWTPPPP